MVGRYVYRLGGCVKPRDNRFCGEEPVRIGVFAAGDVASIPEKQVIIDTLGRAIRWR